MSSESSRPTSRSMASLKTACTQARLAYAWPAVISCHERLATESALLFCELPQAPPHQDTRLVGRQADLPEGLIRL